MSTKKPAPVRLYLVRHGETKWSLSGQHTGRTDIPLTARGEGEAARLAPRLSEIAFAHVLTSPLQRAQQTCALAGLGAAAVSLRIWLSGIMAITKACARWIFVKSKRTGTSFAMGALTEKRLSMFVTAQIVLLPTCGDWEAISHCFRTAN